jgi:hypothetical protein
MNKLRADYLQAMGVDLYVHRLQVDSAQESSSVDTPEAELNKDVDEGGEQETVDPISLEAKKVAEKEISAGPDPKKSAPKEKVSITETSPEPPSEPLKSSSKPAVPLYCLWHQVGELLFLTAASHKQTAEETKLLGAIIESLSRPEKVERGTGGLQPTNENEAQEFLASFVAGRGEHCEGSIILILFGQESQKQFVEIEGDFEDILGSKISSQTDLKEFRLIPALADMLDKPYLKSIAWQSLRDLRTP